MKTFIVSYVTTGFGNEGGVSSYKCTDLRECLIEVLMEFVGYEREELIDFTEEELRERIKTDEGESGLDWMIVSIIEGGNIEYVG